MRGMVFGHWDAPATDDDEPIAAPVGNICMYCKEAIQLGDNGRITPMGQIEHRECSLRAVMGGIGHLVDHDRYCRDLGPDAGLGFRQSSLLVWEFFQRTRLRPTHEELATWRARVVGLRDV